VCFGISVISWLLLGSTVLNRLYIHPVPPPALVPTLAIEFAPSAGVGAACFAVSHGAINGPGTNDSVLVSAGLG
jgi:tellurite resistance protein